MPKDTYDIVIIGGGPAGLTAGIYAGRAKMKTLLLEKNFYGGQVLLTDIIENFPGFPDGIKGPDLMEQFILQAKNVGLNVLNAEAKKLVVEKDAFKVIIDDGEEFGASTVMIATGASWNPLNVPGEKELTGRGVSYCATCDGPLFKDKEVVVVGGGDKAVGDALFLAKFAKKVTIVHRRDELRAAKILQDRVFAAENIEIAWNSVVTKISGKSKVEAVTLKDVRDNKESDLRCNGIFVLIGIRPNSGLAKGVVDTDESGYILTDDSMKTSARGIFACGDVRKKVLRQIVTSCGDGATAAFAAQHYIEAHRSMPR